MSFPLVWCFILRIILFVCSTFACQFSNCAARWTQKAVLYHPIVIPYFWRETKSFWANRPTTRFKDEFVRNVGQISSWKPITRARVPEVRTWTCQSGRQSGIRIAYSRTLNSVPSSTWKARVPIVLQRPSHFKASQTLNAKKRRREEERERQRERERDTKSE